MMKIENLSFSYGENIIFADLNAETGEGITCVMGESGSGKSTLLRCIAGLEKPSGGRIEGAPVRPAFMFQDDRLLPWLTAAENVEAVTENREKAAECLEKTELGEYSGYRPSELSGGMRRRVSMARCLAFDGADMIIMDEPFKGADSALRERLIALIKEIRLPVIIATHSMYEAELLGGNILEVKKYREEL